MKLYLLFGICIYYLCHMLDFMLARECVMYAIRIVGCGAASQFHRVTFSRSALAGDF